MKLGLVVAALATLSASMQAQTLASRIASEKSGAVLFHFTARPEVCGDGTDFIRTGRHQYHGRYWSDRPMEPCVYGPVQVRITHDAGTVTRVQTWVGPLRERYTPDLGRVSATEAARYLLTIAERGTPSASAKAMIGAVLADSAIVWPSLLSIARDTETRSRATRQEAMLWLSRFASGAAVGRHNDPFVEYEPATADEKEKSNAVFVLSQLRHGTGIPDLLVVARTNKSPRVRAQAMFWLGQSGDVRAIDLFERVLRS
jgi:hypothetical protein